MYKKWLVSIKYQQMSDFFLTTYDIFKNKTIPCGGF